MGIFWEDCPGGSLMSGNFPSGNFPRILYKYRSYKLLHWTQNTELREKTKKAHNSFRKEHVAKADLDNLV